MSTDALSRALQARRGKSLDHSLYAQDGHPADHETLEVETHPGNLPSHGEIDHKDQHTPVAHEGHPQGHVPPQVHPSEEPGDVEHETESHGREDIAAEMGDHVMDHASERDYHELKGIKPRSLGERAKMEAMEAKYGKK